MPDLERRIAIFRDAEVDGMNFRGYAAVFDTPWDQRLTEDMGYVETVARGTFRKALSRSDDVPLLWAHDRKELLATTKSGTLKMQEDGKGLLVEAALPQSGLGAYALEMIERGDVQGMSYGIQLAGGDWTVSRRNGQVHRTITNARRMLDVTLTWEPAYPATTAELRSLGFAALPLQALVDGEEAQIDDGAVTEGEPRIASPTDRYIDQLAKEFTR